MATKPISTGTRLTIAEFLDLPDTELREKMELDDGELYIMPRPRPVHQFILMRLYMFIAIYIDGFAEPPAQVHTDMVTILSPSSRRVLVPDLAVMLAGRPYRMVRGLFRGRAGHRGRSPSPQTAAATWFANVSSTLRLEFWKTGLLTRATIP